MINDEVRKYVNNACSKSENVFGESFFNQHLLVVVDYASRLSDMIGGDKEIIQLAGYLHDISAVEDFGTISNHAIASMKIAQSILFKYGYPQARINMVNRCILNHSTPVQLNEGPVEEVCLSNADAISQIINPTYWLYIAFCIQELSFEEGRSWLINKVESNWNTLIDPAKDLIKDQYILVKRLLLIGGVSL